MKVVRVRAPYTYRSDAGVLPFDDGRPLLVFDGMCVLCSSGVQWMLERDPQGAAQFCVIQHPLARSIYDHYGLDPDEFDTFMVLKNGRPYVRWRGVLAAAQTMPAPWSWLGALGHVVPSFIGDRLYDWVQRNRIGWFGVRETCLAPDAIASPERLIQA